MMVSYLLKPDALPSAPKVLRVLHDSALQRLVKFGAQFPAHFRSVMQSSSELKSRLEAAAKAQQGVAQSQQSGKAAGLGSAPPTNVKPSIKLKTDFSNFTG
jgi:hypothetical protein